jgi:hypothetical protein
MLIMRRSIERTSFIAYFTRVSYRFLLSWLLVYSSGSSPTPNSAQVSLLSSHS